MDSDEIVVALKWLQVDPSYEVLLGASSAEEEGCELKHAALSSELRRDSDDTEYQAVGTCCFYTLQACAE